MAEGVKFDQDKLRMDLVPPSGIRAVAEVLTFGAKKYGARNWEKGIDHGRLYAAAMRHLLEYQDGVGWDHESGLDPLAHAACNLFMLIELRRTRPDLDTRPKAEALPEKIGLPGGPPGP